MASRTGAAPAARPLGLLLLAGLAAAPVTRALGAPPWEWLVDLEVYREAGLSVLTGRPVYHHLTPVPQLLPFTYPPVAALAAVPLAVVPFPVAGALWTLAQLAALWWVVARAFAPALARLGRWAPIGRGALTGAACWLEPVADTLWFGQVNLFLVALCLAAVLGSRRSAAPGALAGVATALKLTPGVFVVHLLAAGRRGAAAFAAATAVGLTVAAALVLPGASLDFWAGALFEGDRVGSVAGTSNQSLRGMLLRVGPPGPLGTLLWLGAVAGVAAYGVRAAARLSRAGEDVAAVGAVGLLAVLLSPVAWIHHLAWVVVGLGGLLGDARSRRRVLATIALAGVFATPVPWLGVGVLTADGPVLLGRVLQQGYGIAALVMLGLLARWSVPTGRRRPPARSARTG